MSWMQCELPLGLRGRIVKRQTTFVEVIGTTPSTAPYRIHFHKKHRHMLEHDEFDDLQIFSSGHPVLIDYQEPFGTLEVHTKYPDTSSVVEALSKIIRLYYRGWQHYDEYKLHINVPEQVLSAGYGLLLFAPDQVVQQASNALGEFGINTSIHSSSDFSPAKVQALVFGMNYVIAESFRAEAIVA